MSRPSRARAQYLLGFVFLALVYELFFPRSVFASPGECVAASNIVAGKGPITGSWSDPGVANEVVFDCSDGPCQYTGEIATWPCSDPSFAYAGPDTGYEYAYSFTSPGDGNCTFIEYEEGFSQSGRLLGVVDWFLVVARNDSACGPNDCIAYIWENVNDPICGSDPRATCSSYTFAVVEGQEFFIVADIFAGVDAENPEVYPFNETWSVEVKCDMLDKGIFIDGFEALPKLHTTR